MGVVEIPIREVAGHLANVIGRAQRERVVITRHKKPVAVLISPIELAEMEATIARLQADLAARS